MKNRWDIQFTGPLYLATRFRDNKDPCPVFDGSTWHIYGSGGSVLTETWEILHATAPTLEGPWTEHNPIPLHGVHGKSVAAPGVIFDEGKFHMFVQTDCLALNGRVEYLVSEDGWHFEYVDTVLYSLRVTKPLYSDLPTNSELQLLQTFPEAGIYDSHPAIIRGEKYLVYSGMAEVGRPNIYLAKSITNKWEGPWARVRPHDTKEAILTHEEVIHHNQHDHTDYEWGLEGAQLLELPNGLILLNAVCFLPYGKRGTRQRIFFAASHSVLGPYRTIGPLMNPPLSGWDSGENGHAAAVMKDQKMYLFFQARRAHSERWRLGIIEMDAPKLETYLNSALLFNNKVSNWEIFG
jgi:hypothetical protein